MIWIMQEYIGDLKVVAIHALIIAARNALYTGPSSVGCACEQTNPNSYCKEALTEDGNIWFPQLCAESKGGVL